MKKYSKAFAGILLTAFIVTGCSVPTYVQTTDGYTYYGDGQPGYYYYSGRRNYQYQQPSGVVVSQPSVNFNVFYSQLSPHGVWVNIAPYGQVWIANVPNFQPYSTNGYWAYTTYGWTWVSNYSWGWAPFHYGRWGYDNRYGWYWVPGYEWGPAWVAWSSSADMYGWAPLMPGMHYGVRLTVNLFPSSYWTFMPGRYMGNANIGGYYVNRSRNVTIIKNTTIINNYGTENNRRYSMGPSAGDVQTHTGRSIQPIRVSNTTDTRNTGVSNNELRVYRPVTSSDETSGRTSSTPDNNRTSSQQSTRTQSDQTTTRTSTPQTTQPNQSTTRTSTQTTTQPNQATQQGRSATQQSSESSDYRQNPAQPRVSNNAAPQSTRQIQNAETDNNRSQQRSSTSTSSSGRR